MNGSFVGIDLGGTNIRAAVATGKATHADRVEHPTPHQATPEELAAACAKAALEANGGRPPDGIAIGFPGPLNPATGVVYDAPNLGREWENRDAKKLFEQAARCPVALHNDAKLAGYAEFIAGAGRGKQNMVFITVSTGIGSAIFVDGELMTGSMGIAGEIGHIYIGEHGQRCGSGHTDCLEAAASGTAIANIAKTEIANGSETSLAGLPPEELSATNVEDAANAGDALAIRIFRDAGRRMGRAAGNLMDLINPDVIVIGGGVSKSGDLFLEPMRQAAARVAFPAAFENCPIVAAGLGTDAGLIGACAWSVRSFAPQMATA